MTSKRRTSWAGIVGCQGNPSSRPVSFSKKARTERELRARSTLRQRRLKLHTFGSWNFTRWVTGFQRIGAVREWVENTVQKHPTARPSTRDEQRQPGKLSEKLSRQRKYLNYCSNDSGQSNKGLDCLRIVEVIHSHAAPNPLSRDASALCLRLSSKTKSFASRFHSSIWKPQ